jgi:hypothetical protein
MTDPRPTNPAIAEGVDTALIRAVSREAHRADRAEETLAALAKERDDLRGALEDIGNLAYRFAAFGDRREVMDLCAELHRRSRVALAGAR